MSSQDKISIDDLIDAQVDALSDVAESAGARAGGVTLFSRYMILSVGLFLLATLFFGLREDWSYMASSGVSTLSFFVAELCLSFLLWIGGAAALVVLRAPDAMQRMAIPKIVVGTSLAFLALFLIKSVVFFASGGTAEQFFDLHNAEHQIKCSASATVYASLATLVAWRLVKGGFTTRPYFSSFMLGTNVFGLSWFGLAITCEDNAMFHYFVLHGLPASIITCIVVLACRRIFRW